MSSLQLKIVNISYFRQSQPIFVDISLTLNAGECLIVEGENGSGKSSLLRVLAGLSLPDTGIIFLNDQSIAEHKQNYREALNYLSHMNGLKLNLTILENLFLIGKLRSKPLDQNTLDTVLSDLKLDHLINQPIRILSAGQKRRVALAKLKLFSSSIWILDEPLTGLDQQTQILFLSWLNAHLKAMGICILSSHHALPITAKHLRLTSC